MVTKGAVDLRRDKLADARGYPLPAPPVLWQTKSPHAISGRQLNLICRHRNRHVCRVASTLVVSSLVSSIYVRLSSSAFKTMWQCRS